MYYFTHRISNMENAANALVLDMGEFKVMPGGVMATVHPPLVGLSRYYPWRMLPFAMSALRTLTDGNDGEVVDRLIGRLQLSEATMDVLCQRLDSISADTTRLMSWSAEIADLCPHQDVAADLRRLPMMPSRELDRYIGGLLA